MNINIEKNISIDHLVLSATNICNMDCAHCLRGSSCKTDQVMVEFESVKWLLDNIVSTGTITITGGEPTLNPKFIKELSDYIRTQWVSDGKTIPTFFMVTNGKLYNKQIIDSLEKWETSRKIQEWVMIEENVVNGEDLETATENLLDVNNDYGSEIRISQSPYHEAISIKNIAKYANSRLFKGVHQSGNGLLINEGSVVENGIGDKPLPPSSYTFYVEHVGDDLYPTIVETVYVTANNEVTPCCDLSDYSAADFEELSTFKTPTDLVEYFTNNMQ